MKQISELMEKKSRKHLNSTVEGLPDCQRCYIKVGDTLNTLEGAQNHGEPSCTVEEVKYFQGILPALCRTMEGNY